MPAKPRYDIGIVVPLAEEFGSVQEVALIVRTGGSGRHLHVLDFGPVKAIAYPAWRHGHSGGAARDAESAGLC
jgi:hypothetical protein